MRTTGRRPWRRSICASRARTKRVAGPATIVTIHNIAFQGQFPASLREPLRLPPEAFTIDGVEYYGRIGFLKGGLALADHITTVSPTYAIEIQGSEMGMGLEGLLRHRSHVLSGILNGVDIEVWNPATDKHLVAQYDAQRLDDRQRNKAALRQRFGLADDAPGPLVAVVSRLSWQKGMDLLLAALPRLIAEGGQLALLGAGDAALQAEIAAAKTRHPGRVGAVFGYDEGLSHLMQGGADIILVPSRFEPCGLTQLYGLRYGAVPLVARVGGLADTIIDANDAALAAGVATGFQFAPVAVHALEAALARAAHHLSRQGNLAPHPGARHGDGRELAPAGRSVCRSLQDAGRPLTSVRPARRSGTSSRECRHA